MTNNYNPDQKRGGPANAGNWAKYENSNPEGALPKASDRIAMSVNTGDYLNDGIEDGAIGRLYVFRDNDINGVEQYQLTAEQQVDFGMFVPEDLYGIERTAWSEKYRAPIGDFLRGRFDVTLDGDQNEVDPNQVWVSATVEHSGPIGETEAFNKAWNNTKLVALYNESDSSTDGTLNLDRLVREHLETCSATGVPFHEAREVMDREIDMSVELRAGEREISDRIAAAIAYRLCDDGAARHLGHESAFDKLVLRGSVEKTELNDALREEYAKADSPRLRGRLNAMFTWNIYGGDNA